MSKSIYKQIIQNSFLISTVPLMVVLLFVCILFCQNYKDEIITQNESFVSEYAYRIKNEVNKALDKSDSILKNSYIINNMNKKYTDIYGYYNFIVNANTYLDGINNNNIIIYTTNDDMFEGKYFKKIDKLEQYDALIEAIRQSGTSNTYWNNEIMTDNERKYLTFYREMKMNNASILSMKVYLPESFNELYEYDISYGKRPNEKNWISKECVGGFYVSTRLNLKQIYLNYLMNIIIFALIGIIISLTIIRVIKRNTKKVTGDIEEFIRCLNAEDIINSGMNFEPVQGEATELAVIKKTINRLIVNVKEISDKNYKSELEQKRLKLNLLRNRMNPHVLYNSLTVIKMRADDNNDYETTNIVNRLTAYYRAMLNDGCEYISIENEMKMLKMFIEINEISNGKTFGFTSYIEPGLENIQILYLTLQPFVENCIIHGLGGARNNCMVEVYCRYKNDFLIFEIKDNGYGIDEDTLKKLNNLKGENVGYGIKNTWQRLILEYGTNCSIKYESVLNQYTKVLIKIPYKKDK